MNGHLLGRLKAQISEVRDPPHAPSEHDLDIIKENLQ